MHNENFWSFTWVLSCCIDHHRRTWWKTLNWKKNFSFQRLQFLGCLCDHINFLSPFLRMPRSIVHNENCQLQQNGRVLNRKVRHILNHFHVFRQFLSLKTQILIPTCLTHHTPVFIQFIQFIFAFISRCPACCPWNIFTQMLNWNIFWQILQKPFLLISLLMLGYFLETCTCLSAIESLYCS